MKQVKRVFIIVLDSFGIGEQPDSKFFGDEGSHTLKTVSKSPLFSVPTMAQMGLFNIEGVGCGTLADQPSGAFARMTEKACGKDTTIGHWAIAGLVMDKPLPTYPEGFPPDIVTKLEKAFGRRILCNKPYSGTQVIHDYGQEHEQTGALIVYTSGDSVLQIAAHESVVPPEKLYAYCRMAREIMCGKDAVGRIIARPFIGDYPAYERTSRRHDFSLQPPADTLLDVLQAGGYDVISVGKIFDIFAGRGLTRHIGIDGNHDGMEKTLALQQEDFTGLCFVNLVDFDMKYGHRRDVEGYAAALTDFDKQLAEFLPGMRADDVLFVTADHGCDPEAAGTDHTREYTPLLVYGQLVRRGIDLGTRPTFADTGATVADIFGVRLQTIGSSLWPDIVV